MRTQIEVRCNICDALDYKVLYKKNSQTHNEVSMNSPCSVFTPLESDFGIYFPVVSCNKCGYIYSNPRDQDEDIIEYYRKSAYLCKYYEGFDLIKYHSFSIILDSLSKFINPGKLLDVGCSSGDFIYAAEKRGWSPSGVELSNYAVNIARSRGDLKIWEGELKDVGLQSESFDTVTLIDVIEHVVNPKDILKEIYRVMKPGGILYISTPNVTSLSARLFGNKWYGYRKIHIQYFSPETLNQLLSVIGFKVESIPVLSKYFTVSLLLDRLKRYSPPLYTVFKPVLTPFVKSRKILSMQFGDMEAIARK